LAPSPSPASPPEEEELLLLLLLLRLRLSPWSPSMLQRLQQSAKRKKSLLLQLLRQRRGAWGLPLPRARSFRFGRERGSKSGSEKRKGGSEKKTRQACPLLTFFLSPFLSIILSSLSFSSTRHKKRACQRHLAALSRVVEKEMASITDLDGLALTLIAESLPVASVAALATTCCYFHTVLAADENVAFWKRVAGEVWGVVGVDAPGAVPRLPGGAGAGEKADSWRATCVEHSRLLSPYGSDGARAAKAWHRIEHALATSAPDVLPTLAPGLTLSEEPEEVIHREVLAAAALHNGQIDLLAGGGGGGAAATRYAQLGLFGAAVVYGEGFARWMRNLLPEPGQARRRCVVAPRPEHDDPWVLLLDFASSLPACDPLAECRSLEGSPRLALALDSAAVYVRSPHPGADAESGELPCAAKRADGSRGLLSFLGELAAALETRQLGPERDSFFHGGAMAVEGLDAAAAAAARRGRPPTRGLSRFAAAPPGLAAREAAGALIVSRSAVYTWTCRVFNLMVFNRPRLATDEGHVFSYRVNFELLSVAEQRRRRRQQQGQQGQRGVILRATLMRRQWELRPASRGAEVQVVDGEGVVGFFPTLVAKDDDDDDERERERGGGGDNGDNDASSFCYCSRVAGPPLFADDDTEECHSLPGQRLGSFGGHFLFLVEYEDGSTGYVEAPVEMFEMVVPSFLF